MFVDNWLGLFFLVVMVGFVFRGPVLTAMYKVRTISIHELAALLSGKNPPILLDVRTQIEFDMGHVPNSILIPLKDLSRAKAEELKERYGERGIAVICRSGSRSSMAAVNLRRIGITNVYNVMGGLNAWRVNGYPVKK
ncbi:MAG: rhodanese-like domain-containing protein [Magnetococcales bacterium]|nr:rhodanese-like domain-containing protein [Magnetococcales bacterium]NGZ25672.1 rhodanese-like domain-containing protein [Magnetococcales bacterium]